MSTLRIKVIPKAQRSQIVGWEADLLKVRVAAVPEKGAANAELIRFLAKQLGIAKSRIRLVSGSTNRHKVLEISNIEQDAISAEIEKLLLQNS